MTPNEIAPYTGPKGTPVDVLTEVDQRHGPHWHAMVRNRMECENLEKASVSDLTTLP
jgi:hypothetical protein